MRLKPEHIVSIKDAVAAFDPLAHVYLFGSRVDDQKKGGDIDLLIISAKLTDSDVFSIKKQLLSSLGEQKIDILIAKHPDQSAFIKIAYETGVKL